MSIAFNWILASISGFLARSRTAWTSWMSKAGRFTVGQPCMVDWSINLRVSILSVGDPFLRDDWIADSGRGFIILSRRCRTLLARFRHL